LCVKAPSFGVERYEYLKDIAVATGAKYFSATNGNKLEKFAPADLGFVEFVECGKYYTTLVGGKAKQDELKSRIDELQSLIEQEPSEGACKLLMKRMNKLNSAVAVIKVGGNTHSELIEVKHRVEDALCALRTSIKSGFHAGGGLTAARAGYNASMFRTSEGESYDAGYNAICNAMSAQFWHLVNNSWS
jgi:chaperonin GroEL